MRSPGPERTLVLAIAIAAVVAIAIDVSVSNVPGSIDQQIVRAEAPFEARTAFCPPPFTQRTSSSSVVAFGEPGRDVTVGIEPTDDEKVRLPDDRMLIRKLDGPALGIVGYGGPMHAAALLSAESPAQGADASRCAQASSSEWFFGEGSSSLGYDERILIRNPFPEEAVVAISFYTPSGKTARANLSEVAVPAGETRFVKVNDFILRQPVLGASVAAERGRIIAWRALFAAPEDRPAGVQFTLGAPEPDTEWYFPEGAVGTGLTEELSLLNPNGREAVVSVALMTSTQTVQPPKLVEVRIRPESLKVLSLPEILGGRDDDLGAVGAAIRSTNEVGIVAERTVWYAAGRTGVASEIGARDLFEAWMVPPASVSSTEDSVVVVNPGSVNARVSVTLIRAEGGPIRPRALQDVRVKGGTRRRFVLTNFTGGAPMTAVVTSSERVAAERVSSTGNGDVSAVMGFGLRPSER